MIGMMDHLLSLQGLKLNHGLPMKLSKIYQVVGGKWFASKPFASKRQEMSVGPWDGDKAQDFRYMNAIPLDHMELSMASWSIFP